MRNRSFAMIGCGVRATIGRHIAEIEPGSAVRYAVDPTPRGHARASELFGDGVACFDTVADLLATAPDVAGAIVCTPDHTHAEVTVPLLRAGIPAYVEKPLSVRLADSDLLLSVADETGTPLFVGHNMRHMPVVSLMKRLIDEGQIGEVQAVWCRHFVGNGGDYYFKDWHADRRYSQTLLLQKGAHDIDIIHYLAGSYSVAVQGYGALMVYGDVTSRRDNSDRLMTQWFSQDNWPPREQRDLNEVIDVEDLSMIQMRLANGGFASYQQCHFTPDYWRNYTVIGDRGRLENFGDGGGAIVRVWNRRHDYAPEGDLEYTVSGDATGHDGADVLTMAEFLTFIDGDDTNLVTSALAARNAVATALTGAESIRSGGGTVPVPGRI